MLPEHRFDYRKAKPNRFASAGPKKRVAIVLDEDVAEVFTTTESVNRALRAFIEAMPERAGRGNG
ncbi:MAG TPA: hypothetical protein VLE27_07325 [Thermoanaerobaculia bacterium]|nr:hypothetical protein [Thermoanaerobaculia bacterium]